MNRTLITGGSGFIGTELLRQLGAMSPEMAILNLDIRPPADSDSKAKWVQADMLDAPAVCRIMREFHPTHVLNLAADIGGNHDGDPALYPCNIDGVGNLIAAIRETPSVRRLVAVSTAFVCRPGYTPQHDRDYSPHTAYGRSKAIGEELVRDARLGCEWTILRPGTIWGPGAKRQHYSLLRLIDRGRYVHPGRRPVRRSYGYVKNAARQMATLAFADADKVNHRTFYICDEAITVADWVDECSRALVGRPARSVPLGVMWGVASAADAIAALTGRRFPLTRFRLRSMTEEYVLPVEETLRIVGANGIPAGAAIQEFVNWYRQNEGGDPAAAKAQ